MGMVSASPDVISGIVAKYGSDPAALSQQLSLASANAAAAYNKSPQANQQNLPPSYAGDGFVVNPGGGPSGGGGFSGVPAGGVSLAASGGSSGTPAASAPAPTPYGAFTPPDPAKFADDPLYKFTLGQDLGAVQNSAASRGTYFTPNTMQGLAKTAQNDALAGYQQAYANALGSYTTNRDTAAQNFGESTTQFNGNLAATGQGQQFGLASTAQQLAAQNQGFNQGQVGYVNGVNANDTAYNRARQAWIDAGGQGPLYGGYSQPGAPANTNPAPPAASPSTGYSSNYFSSPAPSAYPSVMGPQRGSGTL